MYQLRQEFELIQQNISERNEKIRKMEDFISIENLTLSQIQTKLQEKQQTFTTFKVNFNKYEVQKGGLENLIESMRKNNENLNNNLQIKKNQLETHEKEYKKGLDNINKAKSEKIEKEAILKDISKKLDIAKQKEIPQAVINQYKEMKNLEEREMSKLSQEANIKVKEINEVRKKIVNLETEKIENEKMMVNSTNT